MVFCTEIIRLRECSAGILALVAAAIASDYMQGNYGSSAVQAFIAFLWIGWILSLAVMIFAMLCLCCKTVPEQNVAVVVVADKKKGGKGKKGHKK